MFGRIRCVEGYGENSRVWKKKTRILMLGRVRPEFQYLKGEGQNKVEFRKF